MKEQLKPCAACGREDAEVSEVLGAHLIKCACGYRVWDVKFEHAVEYWNARLSTYICTECMPPCVIKSDSEPEFCPRGYGIECDECVYNGKPQPVNWQLTE